MIILVDGLAVAAVPGQSVAVALLSAGVVHLRDSPREGAPRGAFCRMGTCQECALEIDGVVALACQAPVRAGLRVTLGHAG